LSNCLYYDGDSFTLPPQGESITTGHILADRLSLQLVHYGFPSKVPAQIIRTAMRYSFNKPKGFMVIGIGINSRLEQHTEDTKLFKHWTRHQRYKFYSEEHCMVTIEPGDVPREIINIFHWQCMEVQTLFNLIALHDYLMYNNINFIIHNLGTNFTIDPEHEFGKGIKEQVDARPRILNFYENSLHSLMIQHNLPGWDYDKYQDKAHPDKAGHAMYADFLWEYIKTYV